MIYIEPIPEKVRGILKTDSQIAAEMAKQTEAILIAKGPIAFADIKETDAHLIPNVGDTVLIGQYDGRNYLGIDGKEYRILREESIIATKEKTNE